MRITVSSGVGSAETMRSMQVAEMRAMRNVVHPYWRQACGYVLLACVHERFAEGPRASAVGCKTRSEASNLCAHTWKARIGGRPRMAHGDLQTRRIHVRLVRGTRSTPSRSHPAVLNTPRPSTRNVERTHALRRVPSQNADVRMAWLLAEASRHLIAQGVLPFEAIR